VYVWVDFRKFLFSESTAKPDFACLRAGSAEAVRYKERENRIVALCGKNGVMIGYGSNFMTEELGWFRITFTTRREALLVGLERVWQSVREAQAEWTDD
jgi:bifunctional pyridoxal-dependent enzyme with beta-cystathionase and maltose regulon repressor activities